MKQKGHIDEFVEATVDVSSGTGHPIASYQLRTLDPIEFHFGPKAALNLPSAIAPERAQRAF